MKESKEKRVVIHDVSHASFVAMIKYLYSNKINLTPELPPNTMPFWLQVRNISNNSYCKNATDDLSTTLLHKMALTHIELHLDFNFVQELLAGEDKCVEIDLKLQTFTWWKVLK